MIIGSKNVGIVGLTQVCISLFSKTDEQKVFFFFLAYLVFLGKDYNNTCRASSVTYETCI